MASNLTRRGHHVTLAYTWKKLSERYENADDSAYSELVKLRKIDDIIKVSEGYDLIHSHNEPDTLTVSAQRARIPVIHDTHDLISLRYNHEPSIVLYERLANTRSTACIYSTQYQRDEAARLYGPQVPTEVLYNFASRADVPSKPLKKLSAKDGKVHVVYEGGVSEKKYHHRDFTDIFLEVATGNVILHIHPIQYSEAIAEMFKGNANIVYHKPVGPNEIVQVMTQYDLGIIPWNLKYANLRFLNSTIANKLFEYMAAGLPVAASPLTSYEDFFRDYNVGTTFNDVPEFHAKIPEVLALRENVEKCEDIFFEDQTLRLEKFYHSVIADSTKVRRLTPVGERKHADTARELKRFYNKESYKRHLLLIAFKFPPFGGVGGLRWSKLALELARMKYKIDVVTVDWAEDKGQYYITDVLDHRNITVHRIPSGFPHNVLYCSDSHPHVTKLKKAVQKSLKMDFFDDEASVWGEYLLPYCKQLTMEKGINVVVATGHPFQANRWAAQLKKECPHLFLLQDFRDPWLHQPYKQYTGEQLGQVQEWHDFCLEMADKVTYATPGMHDRILGEDYSHKGFLTLNSYNVNGDDSFPATKWTQIFQKNTVNIIFSGSLGNRRWEIAETMFKLVQGNPAYQEKFRFLFFSNYVEKFRENFSDLVRNGVVAFNGYVSPQEVLSCTMECDFGLSLLNHNTEQYIPTKVYDYLALEKPVLSISYGGNQDDVVTANNAGLVASGESESIDKLFATLLAGVDTTSFTFTHRHLYTAEMTARTLITQLPI